MAAEDVLVKKIMVNWSIGKYYIEIDKLISIFNALVAQGVEQLDPEGLLILRETITPFRRAHIYVPSGETDVISRVQDLPGRNTLLEKMMFQFMVPCPAIGDVQLHIIICTCYVHIWSEIRVVSHVIALHEPDLLVVSSAEVHVFTQLSMPEKKSWMTM